VNASDLATDPHRAADAAAARLRGLTGAESHDVALVMGSGWMPAAGSLGEPEHEFPVTGLPGFPAPTAAGHAGRLRSYRIDDKRALVFLGRTHYYEGLGVAAVAHGVRTAVAAGCRTVVLTNGCGGLREGMRPGQPVLISDHINMTAASPVVGADFVDLTDLYSPRLRALCQEIDPSLEEGVYVQCPGPHYETPAEINMFRAIGGDLVGMSTVLEAIAAREAGAEVLGISLVTNLAAGMTGEPLSHEEVLRTGRDSAARMGTLLAQVLGARGVLPPFRPFPDREGFPARTPVPERRRSQLPGGERPSSRRGTRP
jgi:purine-nucleoside phosphorylase